MMFLGPIVALTTSCVQQHVMDSVTEHSAVEGAIYAKEVSAQSPFDIVEMSWSEAAELMKVRNHDYSEALSAYEQANEEQPLLQQFTQNVKGTVKISAGEALNPQSLIKMLNEPVTQIPKQLASLSKIKDISHTAKTDVWKHAAVAVDAEIKMRENKVKLQSLLRTGELIDGEIENLKSAIPLPADTDPKVAQSVKKWQATLQSEREKWLAQVRDFFDAEYSDVHFVKDASGLPTYKNVKRPDLTKWARWGQLKRSKELVSGLAKAHQTGKPALPGTTLVTDKISTMLHLGETETKPVRNTESVRSEARQLIQNWRAMKEAQKKAEALEAEVLEVIALEVKALKAEALKALKALKLLEAEALEVIALEAKALEAKALEAKALEAKALEAKALEAKALEAKALEAKALEAKILEAKILEAKVLETKALEAEALGPLISIAHVVRRQTIFNLRRQEIRSAAVVWMMDEECWGLSQGETSGTEAISKAPQDLE